MAHVGIVHSQLSNQRVSQHQGGNSSNLLANKKHKKKTGWTNPLTYIVNHWLIEFVLLIHNFVPRSTVSIRLFASGRKPSVNCSGRWEKISRRLGWEGGTIDFVLGTFGKPWKMVVVKPLLVVLFAVALIGLITVVTHWGWTRFWIPSVPWVNMGILSSYLRWHVGRYDYIAWFHYVICIYYYIHVHSS